MNIKSIGILPYRLYTQDQYQKIIKATVTASSLSLVTSVLTCLLYLYVKLKNLKQINRVSLRCVFCASLICILNTIIDILSVVHRGDDSFCIVSTIIFMFSQLSSACCLVAVGINLVLIFVVDIKNRERLEIYYYVTIFIYTLCAISVPIYQEARNRVQADASVRCYFIMHYYQVMTYGALSWMWFYGFFFLAVIIAICCSIAATVKLVQEHRSLKERLTLIANDSPSRLLTITQNTEHIRNQSNAFSRVAIRSIIYPLVPFICNIWGFITQLKFVNKEMDVPEFSLSLIDTTFASLQGFFIALVFLSDPALMRMYEEKFKHLKQKYLEEFSHIHSYENGSIRIISIRKPDRLQEVIVDKTTNQPRNSVASSEGSIQRPQPIRIANHSVPPFISSPTMYDLENMFSPYYKVVSTPMRRVSISSSIYSQMSHSMHREDTPADDLPNSLSKNFIFRDPDQLNQVYIPYQYPRMANVFHFILSHICKEQ